MGDTLRCGGVRRRKHFGRDKSRPSDCRKRCVYPLAPSARGLRPQAVGERTVRLPEIFRAMAKFSPSAPSGHRSPLWRKRHLPRIGGVCLAEGGQTVKKVHCRGEHCSPVPVCRVRGLPEKALLRQVGGRTMFAPTFSIGQSRCFLTNCFPACAGNFFVLYYPT